MTRNLIDLAGLSAGNQRVFAAPEPQTPGGPPQGRRGANEVLTEIQNSFETYADRTDERLAVIASALDEHGRQIGRFSVGGGAARGTEQDERGFEALRAALRARDGDQAADNLMLADFHTYRAAFAQYCRHGNAALDNPDIRAAMRVGSDPAGGYLVVEDVDPMPRERLFRTSPMRSLAGIVQVSSGRFEGVHETSQFDSGWVGELETRTETDTGALASFGIDADEIYALAHLTQRLLDDSAIDVGAYVESRIGRKFMTTEATAFVTGDGVKKPRGFLDYKDAAVTTADASRAWGVLQYVASGAAGGFPTYSGIPGASDPSTLFDLKAALHPQYRADAVFAMNSTTLATIEKLKDGDGRSYIRNSLDVGTPDRLLGYPIALFEDMPDLASDSYSLAFGNFNVGYQIVEKPGIRVLRDPYTTKGKVQFYAYKRVGGDVVNFDAIKLMKFATS